MNDVDPGEGWREVGRDEWRRMNPGRGLLLTEEDGDRYWVREEPVPPLPTEPGYYVDTDGCAWRLDTEGAWDDTFGNPMDEGQVQPPLTRYEPRAVTAKAVLDRYEELAPEIGDWGARVQIARDFGVTGA